MTGIVDDDLMSDDPVSDDLMSDDLMSDDLMSGDLMSGDLVSVIIPVFNRAHLIGDTVASVLAQHGANFEIIIVNDGSTDATGQVIDDLAQRHPHITAIHQPNRGPAAARNTAVAASNGPWITFLDSDDTMPTDRLANQLAAIAPAEQPAIVIGKQTIEVAPGVDPPPHTLLGLRGTDSSHYIMSMMTRLSTLDAVGGFDKQFEPGEDLELLFRMRRLGVNIIISDQVWTHRRILDDNLSYDIEATRRVVFRAIHANRPRPGDTRPQVPSS